MITYISKKIVHAEPATSDEWLIERELLRDTTFSNATIEPGLDGYMVVYNSHKPNEYWSWTPKEAFEKGYILIKQHLEDTVSINDEYRSNKAVDGFPITSDAWVILRQRLSVAYSDATIAPDDSGDGYCVVYNIGTPSEYWSWVPKETFEADHI